MDLFARTTQLLGAENMEKIKKAKVAVFGLGAESPAGCAA